MDPSKTHNNSGEQKKPDGVVGRNVAPGTIKECLGRILRQAWDLVQIKSAVSPYLTDKRRKNLSNRLSETNLPV